MPSWFSCEFLVVSCKQMMVQGLAEGLRPPDPPGLGPPVSAQQSIGSIFWNMFSMFFAQLNQLGRERER